ncbi:hypothetical protein LUD75_10610 [Epilithonimonas sp. JDS]|uniref:hypothetical protein n=1 Tax=Epilithonimonas sp. JDS TaxID=2902797 RepID=UPI001E29771F|nr:hypothetical protein [Epilithonimonas sp. JDS]MCD9855162.1 hypothetical protein [Epilithonimonas sp. JDS]
MRHQYKKQKYEELTGKSREEVKSELGEGFNFYHNEIWTYNLRKDWLGRWIYLHLHFKDNKVESFHIGRRSIKK